MQQLHFFISDIRAFLAEQNNSLEYWKNIPWACCAIHSVMAIDRTHF